MIVFALSNLSLAQTVTSVKAESMDASSKYELRILNSDIIANSNNSSTWIRTANQCVEEHGRCGKYLGKCCPGYKCVLNFAVQDSFCRKK